MPDISMCSNKKCPKRKQCYRFMAKPYTWQSYTDFDYDKVEGCPAFIQIVEAMPAPPKFRKGRETKD